MTPFIDRATFCTRPIIRRLRLVILAAVVMIAACGNPIDPANFDKVSVGMPKDQVIAVLGRPSETTSINLAGISGEAATWRHGGDSISIQFANDKVLAKQSQFQRR